MVNIKGIIFVSISAALVIVALLFLQNENSAIGIIIQEFKEPDWKNHNQREIIKTSFPVIVESIDENNCKVKAEQVNAIITHVDFTKSEEFIKKVQYNSNDETMILPCDANVGEKLKFNIWYIVASAKKDASKYTYWLSDWSNNSMTKGFDEPPK